MKTFRFEYTCLETWCSRQELITGYCDVTAENKDLAIDWFLDNVQSDYDLVEEAA